MIINYFLCRRGIFSVKKAICCIFLLVFITSCSHESDKVLETRYQENKNQFNELGSMLEQDRGLEMLGMREVIYNAEVLELTKERLSSYRELMRKLKIIEITRDNDNSVILHTSYGGFLSRTSGKGYYLSKGTIAQTVPSLDDVIKSDQGHTKQKYKHLEGHWYLAYESQWDVPS